MQSYLEQLRKKPEHHRRGIALGVSGAVTAIVFVVWLSVLSPSGNGAVVAQKVEQKTKGESPISALKNGMAQVIGAFKENLGKAGDTINLGDEYNKMKNQVESGEIKLVPANSGQ